MDGSAAEPAGEGGTPCHGPFVEGGPRLALDGFSGTLEALLALARAQQLDLARISLADFAGQMVQALQRAAPLGGKASWLVMASWLVLLRSRLLLPASPTAQQAQDEAERLRDRLAGLAEAQALATWLDCRPQLGRDVFARGQPELLGTSLAGQHEVDVIAFLWACFDLFGDDEPDTTPAYQPVPLGLHSVTDARERILQLLADMPGRVALGQLLPAPAAAPQAPAASGALGIAAMRNQVLLRRSAWSSTLIASLELAKQGVTGLHQEGSFTPIYVSFVWAEGSSASDG